MNPMDRVYGEAGNRFEEPRSFAPYGDYSGYERATRFGDAQDSGRYGVYGAYVRHLDADFYGDRRSERGPEHVWRGGVLGWLGSGVRAGAAWVGNSMQRWGAVLGGKLEGTSADLARAMRGRGEEMGSAMEHRGEDMMRSRPYGGWPGRAPRSYRRPDDRILDDVHQRVATAGVDADEVEIEVSNGVVTLSGRVPHRFDKRVLEEIAERVFGVQEVRNHLRLARRADDPGVGRESAAGPSGNGPGAPFRPSGGAPS